MVDNVVADAGAGGATFATDDVAGVHYPISKLAHGALDSVTIVSTVSGLPVQQQGTWTVAAHDVGSVTTAVVPGTGATNLGKAEDAVHVSGDTGVAVLTVRRDVAAVGSGLDGDYSTLNVDAAGKLWTNCEVTVALPAGTNAIGKLAANSGVDIGDVDVTSVITGTGATNLGKAEDAAHVTGDTGVFVLVVRSDTAAQTAGTDGDYCALICDASGRLHCNVGNTVTVAAHNVTNAGTFVVQDSEKLADDAAFTVATTKVQPVGFLADETSPDLVDEGDVGAARMTLARMLLSVAQAHTQGGASMSKTISAASTNATNVKSSAGQLYGVQVFNTNAGARYLKVYDKATAPTIGTDVPVKVLTVPGNTAGGGLVIAWPTGLPFTNGIGFGTTTGAPDSDTGAVAANEIVINLDYK